MHMFSRVSCTHKNPEYSPVFVLVRASPPVFAVVVVRTGITLTAQARWFLTEFCLVVGQHIVVI